MVHSGACRPNALVTPLYATQGAAESNNICDGEQHLTGVIQNTLQKFRVSACKACCP